MMRIFARIMDHLRGEVREAIPHVAHLHKESGENAETREPLLYWSYSLAALFMIHCERY